MSIKGIPYGDVLYKKSNHHKRNDSDELDVFEAAQYFSAGATHESSGLNGAVSSHDQKKPIIIRDNTERKALGGRRMSLDMPTAMRNQLPNSLSHHQIQKQVKENKKYKQPSSPGAKLASFLNSLFNQNSSKNKKSSSKISTQTSMKEDHHHHHHHEESNGMRRKRRSSISHFQSSINTNNNTSSDHKKSPYYSSSLTAGFRTPPPPTKVYKDFRTESDDDDHQSQRQVGSNLSKYSGRVSSISLQDEKNRDMDFSNWMELDDKFKFINGFSEKNKKFSSSEKKDERRVVVDHVQLNDDEDDGGESDSSSDLFELRNYDLGARSISSDLPVFETTHIESIKRGPPIAIS